MNGQSLFLATALMFVGVLFTSCDLPTAGYEEPPVVQEQSPSTFALDDVITKQAGSAWSKRTNAPRVAGVVWAKWGECEGDGRHGGGHEEGGHEDDRHEDGECTTRRPAREFALRVIIQDADSVRGSVVLEGVGEYEGTWFTGPVTWYQQGEASNEAFLGGPIDDSSSVRDGCFLVGVQDNGPRHGAPRAQDQIHYRIYGSSQTPCHVPDHFPKRFPAVGYRGNVQVLGAAGPNR